MAAPGVQEYFDKQEGDVADVALSLRDLLDDVMPGAEVKLAWGFPCWLTSPKNRVASIVAHKERCNLQFWQGAKLAEEFPGRVEGTGKDLRHVKVRRVSDIDGELRRIVERAASLPDYQVR